MYSLLDYEIVHRIIGTVAGTIVSLAYVMPKTSKDFWRRVVVSALSGMVLGGILRERLSLPQTYEGLMCGAFLAAVVAWAGMAVAMKFMKKWGD